MAGEYRTEAVLAKLPAALAKAIRGGLRIGLTNQPMTGVTIRKDMTDEMAQAFEKAGELKYATGLVIDGDLNDLRFLDPKGVVVGLSAKGSLAKNDKSGFVIHTQKELDLSARQK